MLCVCTSQNLLPPFLVQHSGVAAAWQARGYAVDSKHRSTDEMHRYLDALFCLKDKVAMVTGACVWADTLAPQPLHCCSRNVF